MDAQNSFWHRLYGTQATKPKQDSLMKTKFSFHLNVYWFLFISKFATFDLNNMKKKPNVLYVNKKT